MVQLRIPLTDIKEEGLRVEEEFSAEQLQPQDSEALPPARATIRGTLTRMGDEVLFRGKLNGVFTSPCDRCLEPVDEGFHVDCTWFFEPDIGQAPEAEDEEVRRLDGDVVDLGRYAWEEMVLALPAKFICPPDKPCAGREWMEQQTEMTMEEAEAANPFAQLKNMFPGWNAEGQNAGHAGDDNKE